MERVRQLLEKTLNENIKQIVISNPRKKAESAGDSVSAVSKVKIRPLILADKLMYQESRFVGNQVFHANYDKPQLTEDILILLKDNFSQMELDHDELRATVLISKKGTVTVKQKKKPVKESSSEGNAGDKPARNKSRDLSHNREKQYILKEGIPVPFLIDLGVQTADGKIVRSKYDKFKQINRFLEFIRDVLPALPADRKVSILDFGCGKSYLTFAMYYYLKELNHYDIDVIGLDLKKDVIRRCNELKDKYGYDGLQFLEGDISHYQGKDQVDMVVTLHACDTATDYAIAKAIAWNAKVILSVPCCQHEMNRQIACKELNPVLKYGLLKDRMSAILTDGIRANMMEIYGYETQVMEFIDMSHTPKNVLLRGIKKEGFSKRGTTLEEVEELLNMLGSSQTLVNLLKE